MKDEQSIEFERDGKRWALIAGHDPGPDALIPEQRDATAYDLRAAGFVPVAELERRDAHHDEHHKRDDERWLKMCEALDRTVLGEPGIAWPAIFDLVRETREKLRVVTAELERATETLLRSESIFNAEMGRVTAERDAARQVIVAADAWRKTLDLPQQDLGCAEFNEAWEHYDDVRDDLAKLDSLRSPKSSAREGGKEAANLDVRLIRDKRDGQLYYRPGPHDPSELVDAPSPATPLETDSGPPGFHEARVFTDSKGTLAFVTPGFTTVRACRHCGVLIAGGPTACVACAAKDAPRQPLPGEIDEHYRTEHVNALAAKAAPAPNVERAGEEETAGSGGPVFRGASDRPCLNCGNGFDAHDGVWLICPPPQARPCPLAAWHDPLSACGGCGFDPLSAEPPSEPNTSTAEGERIPKLLTEVRLHTMHARAETNQHADNYGRQSPTEPLSRLYLATEALADAVEAMHEALK